MVSYIYEIMILSIFIIDSSFIFIIDCTFLDSHLKLTKMQDYLVNKSFQTTSKIDMASEAVKVAIRWRPLVKREGTEIPTVIKMYSLILPMEYFL